MKTAKNNKISNFFLLFVIMFSCISDFLAFDIHLPNMPEMGKDLKTSNFMIQMVFISSLSISWIVQLFWGQISDSYGRRKIAIISMILAFFGQVGCIFATTIEWLLFFRVFQYLFVGGMWSALFGLIVDWFQNDAKRAKIFSLFDLMYPLSIMVAPIIGAFLGDYIGWRGNFAFLAILQLISIILVYLYLPETILKKSKLTLKIALNSYKKIIMNKHFMLINIITCLIFTPVIIFTAHSAYLYIEYFKFSPQKFSLLQAIPMFVSFIATLFYINTIRKTKINVAIKVGFYILIIFCIFGLLLNSSIIQSSAVNLVVLISISVFSDKFMRPGLEAELFSIFKEKAASALAVNIASFSLITAPMTAACAHTFDGTPKSILLWMICPGILTIVLYYVKSKITAV